MSSAIDLYSDAQVSESWLRGFGWGEIAHGAVSRRPPLYVGPQEKLVLTSELVPWQGASAEPLGETVSPASSMSERLEGVQWETP
jgi:hypothetical protein